MPVYPGCPEERLLNGCSSSSEVEATIIVAWRNSVGVHQWRNFQNQFTFAEGITKSKRAFFLNMVYIANRITCTSWTCYSSVFIWLQFCNRNRLIAVFLLIECDVWFFANSFCKHFVDGHISFRCVFVWAIIKWVQYTQPFYGSVEFVRENPGAV